MAANQLPESVSNRGWNNRSRTIASLVLFTLAVPTGWCDLVHPAIGRSLPGCSPANAQENPGAQEDSVDRDYSSELQRIAPVPADKALETFEVADGFRLEQVAAEPLVEDPIAMAFDENFALYVIEMKDYSEHPDENWGQVRLLTDDNLDGKYDRSVVFAEDLSWPVAITCYQGGVFVGAPPHLWYLKDTTGDGRADVREIVLTGFGRSNVQGLMNSLHWGLDQRVHGATSSSGAELKRPQDDPSLAVRLRGRDFSFDPRTFDVQATSGGGQHGMDFNRWGEKFVCSNSNHLQFVHYQDRYLANNPKFAAPGPTRSIAADGPQADVFRISPVEPWRIVRTRLRKKGIVPGPVEGGGTPAGYFTGATGVTIFEGTAWPKTDHDWAIIGDVGSNLVHRKRLNRVGASFIGERVDEQSELLRSKDIWFRPVQYLNGPDGALYILDMYREVIEHPASLHPVIKKHLDLDSGSNRGRIYRLVGDEFEQPKLIGLGDRSTQELIELLDHPNDWHRLTAHRLLSERRDPQSVNLLKQHLLAAPTDVGCVLMLSLLQGFSAIDEPLVEHFLEHPNPRVRVRAVMAAETLPTVSVGLLQSLAEAVDDVDPFVRQQAAWTLGGFDRPIAREALAKLAAHPSLTADEKVAVQVGLSNEVAPAVKQLIDADATWTDPQQQEWLAQLLKQMTAQQNPRDLVALLEWMSELEQQAPDRLDQMIQALGIQASHPWFDDVQENLGPQATQRRQELLAAAAAIATDPAQPAEQRLAAIYRLSNHLTEDQVPGLLEQLDPSQPVKVQRAIVEALLESKFRLPAAKGLLQRWPGLTPEIRRQAMDGLLTRLPTTRLVLAALEDEGLQPSDIASSQVRWLTQHPDDEVSAIAERVLAPSSDRQPIVERYQTALEQSGDAVAGEAVFRKHCATCHQVSGIGVNIGPSLAGMRNRGADALLLNILDPNREINPQYLAFVVQTLDGDQLSGMISSETATSVTLVQPENKSRTLLRDEIDVMRSSGVSLMPEGLEREISVDAMADLLSFLMKTSD